MGESYFYLFSRRLSEAAEKMFFLSERIFCLCFRGLSEARENMVLFSAFSAPLR